MEYVAALLNQQYAVECRKTLVNLLLKMSFLLLVIVNLFCVSPW